MKENILRVREKGLGSESILDFSDQHYSQIEERVLPIPQAESNRSLLMAYPGVIAPHQIIQTIVSSVQFSVVKSNGQQIVFI